MPNVVINVGTAHVNLSGIGLMQYADHYYRAARLVSRPSKTVGFDPVPYQLYCQALELRLKAYAWLQDTKLTRLQLRNRYGHDLAKLWRDAKHSGIARYARVTPQRDSAIALVASYYKDRKFCYTDIVMTFSGSQDLRRHPRTTQILARLVAQLGVSLDRPIVNAS